MDSKFDARKYRKEVETLALLQQAKVLLDRVNNSYAKNPGLVSNAEANQLDVAATSVATRTGAMRRQVRFHETLIED